MNTTEFKIIVDIRALLKDIKKELKELNKGVKIKWKHY